MKPNVTQESCSPSILHHKKKKTYSFFHYTLINIFDFFLFHMRFEGYSGNDARVWLLSVAQPKTIFTYRLRLYAKADHFSLSNRIVACFLRTALHLRHFQSVQLLCDDLNSKYLVSLIQKHCFCCSLQYNWCEAGGKCLQVQLIGTLLHLNSPGCFLLLHGNRFCSFFHPCYHNLHLSCGGLAECLLIAAGKCSCFIYVQAPVEGLPLSF